MTKAASADDFRQLLEHRRNDATIALGKKTAQIQSDAASKGALSNGRLPLIYIEAAAQTWRDLVDATFDDLRSYSRATDLSTDVLVKVAQDELKLALQSLREASKIDRQTGAWADARSAAGQRYEQEWAKLEPYLDLKMRQFELGIEDAAKAPQSSVTNAIHAHTITGPILQGSHHSTQTVTVSGDTFFAGLETTISSEIADDQDRHELLALVRELSASKDTSNFLEVYQRFMAAAANHVTVLGPFLPALAQMIGR